MLFNLVQSEYHLIDAFSYFIAAAVPIYFLIKSRNSLNNPLRKVMVILAGFVMAQGVYHIAGVLGLNLISKVILEPLSAAVLVSAALVYFLIRRRMLKQEVNSSIGK
jgi:cobalamin biosynthesis protein CobD/CbiB